MEPHLVKLCYREGRDHVQGADIFSALVELTKPEGPIDLRINRVIRHHVEAYPMADRHLGSHVNATLELSLASMRKTIAVKERLDLPIACSKPYDEGAVIRNAVVDGYSVSSKRPGSGTFVERVLALNKVLLASVAGAHRRWWFTRLTLEAPPAFDDVSLELGLIGGLRWRLIKSRIFSDGKRVGDVYFSERTAI